MIVQTGMNATTVRWRRVVYDFLEELRAFLGGDEVAYKVTFLQLSKAYRAASPWDEPIINAGPECRLAMRVNIRVFRAMVPHLRRPP